MTRIDKLTALEILDSRGRPTIQVNCRLTDGTIGSAQVPSGASTGHAEAVELRDGDPARYDGLGCLKAVANVEGPITVALNHVNLADQTALDERLIALDGTTNKSNLGANTILGVSIAFARACATAQGMPLYQYFAGLIDQPPKHMPGLTVNLFSGGKHAGGQVPLQDMLVVPVSASTVSKGLEDVIAVYNAAANLVLNKYGMRRLSADEGGLAPPFPDIDAMFDDALKAITDAGFTPGQDISLALDVAASHFHTDEGYILSDKAISAAKMITTLSRWVRQYPVVSVEDGLAEDDWDNWPALKDQLLPGTLILGDDLLCTNSTRIQQAIDCGACNALLLKVNQTGTLTEAASALKLARQAGWQVIVSARSGETEDTWLADLAVGWSADHIKVGSITQSERLAKYNRLLAIEAETGLAYSLN